MLSLCPFFPMRAVFSSVAQFLSDLDRSVEKVVFESFLQSLQVCMSSQDFNPCYEVLDFSSPPQGLLKERKSLPLKRCPSAFYGIINTAGQVVCAVARFFYLRFLDYYYYQEIQEYRQLQSSLGAASASLVNATHFVTNKSRAETRSAIRSLYSTLYPETRRKELVQGCPDYFCYQVPGSAQSLSFDLSVDTIKEAMHRIQYVFSQAPSLENRRSLYEDYLVWYSQQAEAIDLEDLDAVRQSLQEGRCFGVTQLQLSRWARQGIQPVADLMTLSAEEKVQVLIFQLLWNLRAQGFQVWRWKGLQGTPYALNGSHWQNIALQNTHRQIYPAEGIAEKHTHLAEPFSASVTTLSFPTAASAIQYWQNMEQGLHMFAPCQEVSGYIRWYSPGLNQGHVLWFYHSASKSYLQDSFHRSLGGLFQCDSLDQLSLLIRQRCLDVERYLGAEGEITVSLFTRRGQESLSSPQ